MFETIKRNVLLPLQTRLGTMVAMLLAPYGVHGTTAEMISVGIIGIGCIACDLLQARFRRKAIERDVLIGKVP